MYSNTDYAALVLRIGLGAMLLGPGAYALQGRFRPELAGA